MKQDNPVLLPTSRSSRRMRWGMPLLVFVLIAGGGGAWMAMHSRNTAAVESADRLKKDKKPDFYELAPTDFSAIEIRDLRVVLQVSGTLTALNQATVKAKVAAEVRDTPVPEGIAVKRGQVVVRLDAADLQARLLTQQAAQEEARARLSLARKNHETNLTLMKQKFISQNAFDTAENSVELTQAALKSADSQVDIARRALEDAVVRAPIDGIISKRFVQPGEKVAPDMPLFAMVNLSQLILEASVPASEIPRVKIGQEVVFGVDGFAGRAFNGKVVRINPTVETGSRAMLVYVAVDNPDGALKGGMFAKGSVTLDRADAITVVPVTALRIENGANVVHKIENGKVVSQPVTLGLRNDDEGLVEVKSGLVKGTHVIVAKLDGVNPGSGVKLPGAPATSEKK